MDLPAPVNGVLAQLNKEGFSAYLVGGAVRDHLMGRQAGDYDIATSARPEQVRTIFPKTVATGLKFGTVTVWFQNMTFEVTTYRSEGRYSDGRRPDSVKYTDKVRVDLARRDFTINAMAYHPEEGLIDLYGGQKDLKLGVIRCVGDAKRRFTEDALRMLRAVRLATALQGELEKKTQAAMVLMAANIQHVSAPRIRDELNKLLVAPKPSSGLMILFTTGLISYILPELIPAQAFNQHNPHHDKTVLQHILTVLDHVENKLELRLAALLHDIGKPQVFTLGENRIGHFYGHQKVSAQMTETIMKRLCYAQKTIVYVRELVFWHMGTRRSLKPAKLKKFILQVGVDKLEDLFALMVADRSAKSPPFDFSDIYRLKFACDQILQNNEPLSLKDLCINGHDLMRLGYRGKAVGSALKEIQLHVWNVPQDNQREVLLSLAKKAHAQN